MRKRKCFSVSHHGRRTHLDPTSTALSGDPTSALYLGRRLARFPGKRDTKQCVRDEVSADGSQVLYSTYLGGSQGDGASGIAVEGSGSAYVTGFTFSPDFPTTAGAF
jgi:hypothetical protein